MEVDFRMTAIIYFDTPTDVINFETLAMTIGWGIAQVYNTDRCYCLDVKEEEIDIYDYLLKKRLFHEAKLMPDES